jgi:hypothetical protein
MTEIRCATCGAMPYPADPTIRESFELRRFNAAGEISESPLPGMWFCPAHAPAKSKRTARAIQGSPLEAIDAFESLLADETARLAEALPGDDDDNRDDAEAALDTFGRETVRGLGQLKAAIIAHAKPVAKDKLKSRRKAIVATEHQPGQGDLMEVPGDTS